MAAHHLVPLILVAAVVAEQAQLVVMQQPVTLLEMAETGRLHPFLEVLSLMAAVAVADRRLVAQEPADLVAVETDRKLALVAMEPQILAAAAAVDNGIPLQVAAPAAPVS